ncbi:hypothetical protein EIP91_011893 [Steccherinum ochraceum]|uniref:BTB domain-containing protein n=1 Tax=Steccherinum ochraceum TaxID=92696 RepID=A0A4R0RHL3_9APHY|nr:hypothetical protein EIP91_011893 [Steccherinum ochraceum]
MSATHAGDLLAQPQSDDGDPAGHTPTADSLFHDPQADIILRSCDSVDFRVYKTILAQASPFFHTTLTLPQTENVNANAGTKNIPVIDMAEDSEFLEAMLMFCYPVSCDPITDADNPPKLLRVVLEIARKFEIARARSCATAYMVNIAATDPVLVYALSCQYGFVDLARRAAECSLQFRADFLLRPHPEAELSHLTAEAFRSLMMYHDRCRQAAELWATSWGVVYGWRIPRYFWFMGGPHGEANCPSLLYYNGEQAAVQNWFRDVMKDVIAELKRSPAIGDHVSLKAIFHHFLMGASTSRSSVCVVCGPIAANDMAHFVERFHQDMRSIMATVQLDVSHIVDASLAFGEPDRGSGTSALITATTSMTV